MVKGGSRRKRSCRRKVISYSVGVRRRRTTELRGNETTGTEVSGPFYSGSAAPRSVSGTGEFAQGRRPAAECDSIVERRADRVSDGWSYSDHHSRRPAFEPKNPMGRTGRAKPRSMLLRTSGCIYFANVIGWLCANPT